MDPKVCGVLTVVTQPENTIMNAVPHRVFQKGCLKTLHVWGEGLQ